MLCSAATAIIVMMSITMQSMNATIAPVECSISIPVSYAAAALLLAASCHACNPQLVKVLVAQLLMYAPGQSCDVPLEQCPFQAMLACRSTWSDPRNQAYHPKHAAMTAVCY